MLNDLINVDLHIHSKASQYKEDSIDLSESDALHCDMLLDKLLGPPYEVRLFSITDHNRFDPDIYEEFYKRIAERRLDIDLLAGVEFDVQFDSVKDAVHVITIFDAVSAEDRQKISDAIEKDKLNTKDESYSLIRYGKILCDINLPTILIAHQHTGLNAPHHEKRSMTKGTDEAVSYYQFGYIDALEFTTPKVEAILRSELKDLHLPQSMLVGSDCHEWSVYPKHDRGATRKTDTHFMRLRALPSFRGLLLALTSPKTRIGAQHYNEWENHLASIEICGQSIPLSPGINAVIGENGVGKSSLLALITGSNASRKNHVKAVREAFEIEVSDILSEDKCIYIEQGKLQDDCRGRNVFDRGLYHEVNHDIFEALIKQYSDGLKSRVKLNIDRKLRIAQNGQASIRIDPEKENGKTHYIRVEIEHGFAEVSNPYEASKHALLATLQKLNIELANEAIYEADEVDKLAQAWKLINEVKQSIGIKSLNRQAEGKAKSYLQELLEKYEENISERSSTFDNDIALYRERKATFVSALENLARIYSDNKIDSIGKVELPPDCGIARNISGGFNFVMAANYAGSVDVSSDFLKAVFNSRFQTQEAIESISDETTVLEALTGATSGNWETVWSENLNKYIIKAKECSPSILDLDNNGIGDTLGEEALTFYKYKTSSIWREEEHKTFIVDQPEDNISNVRISTELSEHFNRLRGSAQMIMVTHNPLLVVNQDVDNVIVMRKEDGKPTVTAGCLESENEKGEMILDLVADIMDGGREAVKRRLKAYGQEDPCDRGKRQRRACNAQNGVQRIGSGDK